MNLFQLIKSDARKETPVNVEEIETREDVNDETTDTSSKLRLVEEENVCWRITSFNWKQDNITLRTSSFCSYESFS